MTVSILLYGSRARGDGHDKSDVDLLSIKTDGSIKFREEKKGVTLHEYPFSYLEEKASVGNLFLLHIVSEAIPMADDLNLLGSLKKAFKYKNNYDDEKNEAAAIYWYCKAKQHETDDEKLRKRLIWVIRTTIIADSASKKNPIFSSNELEQYSKIKELKHILDNRDETSINELLGIAYKLISIYSKFIKPKDSSYKGLIKWMSAKGSIARSTPAYFNNITSTDFFQDFYL